MYRLTLTVVAFLALAVLVFGQSNNRCPYCTGLACGPDGAGGTCGSCPFGQTCIRGRCVCNRDCTAKHCGPDTCGNDCGECLSGQTCVNSLCTGACTPQCIRTVNGASKTCGWDRCGGNCGSCPTGFRCKDGICLCYPNCNTRNCGPDGCGGSCGTCTTDAVCNSDVNDPLYGTCYTVCDRCGDGICSNTETSTTLRAAQFGQTYCPQDCGSITGIISLAVGQKDQLNNITIDFFDQNPYLNDREMSGRQTQTVLSDTKGSFGIYNAQLTGGDPGQEKRIYFRLRGVTTDRTTGATVPLLDLWWNFALINSPNLNFSPNFYFYMSPLFTDSDALFRVILSWGSLLSDRASTIPDVDLFIAGPVDSETMAATESRFRNGIINFANKDYKSTNANTILPFAKTVADSAQGFGPEVIDVLKDSRIGAPDQAIGISGEYPSSANEVNEYEFWVDRPNSNSNADNWQSTLSDTNCFLIIYRGSSVGPTVINQQLFFGDYPNTTPYLFGFYNKDPYNAIPSNAASWHVFNLALRSLNSDTNIGSVSTTNIFEFQNIPSAIKYAYDTESFAVTKTIPCSHSTVNAVPGNLAYCPYTLTYPQKKKSTDL